MMIFGYAPPYLDATYEVPFAGIDIGHQVIHSAPETAVLQTRTVTDHPEIGMLYLIGEEPPEMIP